MTERSRHLNYGKDKTSQNNSNFQRFFGECCYKGSTFHTLTYNKVTLFRCSSCLSFCIFVVVSSSSKIFQKYSGKVYKVYHVCSQRAEGMILFEAKGENISRPFHLIKCFFRVLIEILSCSHLHLMNDFPVHYEMA